MHFTFLFINVYFLIKAFVPVTRRRTCCTDFLSSVLIDCSETSTRNRADIRLEFYRGTTLADDRRDEERQQLCRS